MPIPLGAVLTKLSFFKNFEKSLFKEEPKGILNRILFISFAKQILAAIKNKMNELKILFIKNSQQMSLLFIGSILKNLIFISFLLIIYSCDNYSIDENDADGSALFASSFGDGGYQENVTSKKINVQDIAAGTYYWKVITTDNDNSSKSATSYVRKFIIN